MMDRMIGVVGGLGPYAGIDLVRKIYDQTKAISDQDHLPVAMLAIPHNVANRTDFLLSKIKDNPGKAIAEIIKSLADIGADIIGIPCNTAHAPAIFNCIQENINQKYKSVEIVHMIKSVATYTKDTFPALKTVGVLSTTGTKITNIYPNIIDDYGIKVIHVSDETQDRYVQPAITNPQYGIKAYSNPVTEKAVNDLHHAILELKKMGAEAVILGCTEIPLAITETVVTGLPIIDATLILARALIQAAYPAKLKEMKNTTK